MELSINENHRIAVIALFKCGKSPSEIFKVLKPLKISRMFVYRAIKRYEELSGTQDRARSGRPRTVRTPDVVKTVRERIRQNPLQKQTILSQELNVSTRTMSRLVRNDLNIRAYHRSTRHLLSPALKKIRLSRADRLSQWHAINGHENILFTDEKLFSIKKNDRTCAHSSDVGTDKMPRVQIGYPSSSIMVWWGVSHQGLTKLHYCEKGVKNDPRVYQQDVLEGAVKPLNTTLFAGKEWVFQQGSAPAHKAKTTQEWLRREVPAFIADEDWPSGSPDLNPLEYRLWSVLEEMACKKRHDDLDSLKRSLEKAAAEIPMETVRAAIAEWPNRLKACVNACGGHFE